MKTAQEWQKELNLDGLPDAEMLALLNEVAGMGDVPVPAEGSAAAQMVSELDVDGLEGHIEELHTAKTIGAALGAMRGAKHLGVREMGRRLGVQASAVVKIEKGENAELLTVARYATAAGYRARLILEPENGSGPVISTALNTGS